MNADPGVTPNDAVDQAHQTSERPYPAEEPVAAPIEAPVAQRWPAPSGWPPPGPSQTWPPQPAGEPWPPAPGAPAPSAWPAPGAQGGWVQSPWGQWAPPGWSPPPQQPPARRFAFVAAAVVALLGVGAGVGAGVALAGRSSGTTPLLSLPGSATSNGSAGPLAPLPTAAPSTGSGQGRATTLDPAAIAAKLDPAIVDVNVTVSGGTAQGTGMILTSSGEVLTNNHVVEGATSVTVQINGAGPQRTATVVGVDPTDDVALLQIDGASGLPTVLIGNSSSLSVGDPIIALGNALGAGGTPKATQGTITALNQTITASDANGANQETLNGMIQVQAGIQPGDSGGPLADSSGNVVGMTTAGSTRARRTGTVGFAIPIENALTVARQIQTGSGPNVLPGHRGIMGVVVDGSVTTGGGGAVTQVQAGSPAEGAGIKAGDLITGVDGTTVTSAAALGQALQTRRPGDTVTVQWKDSAGQSHTAKITLEPGPPA